MVKFLHVMTPKNMNLSEGYKLIMTLYQVGIHTGQIMFLLQNVAG